jgi:uncharacterized protein (DUF983 family)
MRRGLRILIQGLLLICPACQRGKMFRSFFTMNVRCPVCGVIFERDAGEVTGGMAINTTVTSALVIVAAAYLALFTSLSSLALILLLTICTVAFSLWFYRHARGLWTSILYLTGSMFED